LGAFAVRRWRPTFFNSKKSLAQELQPVYRFTATSDFNQSFMMLNQLAVRWFERVWNARDISVIPELTHTHVKGHMEGGVEINGIEPFLKFREQLLLAIPDFHIAIIKATCQDDFASVLWRVTGTHSGTGMNFLPTGQKLDFTGSTWFRFEDGKIIEAWDCWNQAALLHKLSRSDK
jgi:predicted ester cyclase